MTERWNPVGEDAPILIGRTYRMELTIASRSVGARLQTEVNGAINDSFDELGRQAPDARFDIVEVTPPVRVPDGGPLAHMVSVTFDTQPRPQIGGAVQAVALIAAPILIAGKILTSKKLGAALIGALLIAGAVVVSLVLFDLRRDLGDVVKVALWLFAIGGAFIVLYPAIQGAVREGRRRGVA